MSGLTPVLAAAGYLLFLILVIALCKAAKKGDRMAEKHRRNQ